MYVYIYTYIYIYTNGRLGGAERRCLGGPAMKG